MCFFAAAGDFFGFHYAYFRIFYLNLTLNSSRWWKNKSETMGPDSENHGSRFWPAWRPDPNHGTIGPENHGSTYFFWKNHGSMDPWLPWKPWVYIYTDLNLPFRKCSWFFLKSVFLLMSSKIIVVMMKTYFWSKFASTVWSRSLKFTQAILGVSGVLQRCARWRDWKKCVFSR